MSVKLYVAGVAFTTTDKAFADFFGQFGAVEEALVMREQVAGRSRGFGFVTFRDATVAEKVLTQDLELDGRKLDLKKAVPKTEMAQQQASSEVDLTPSSKKLYVAGIAFTATEEQVATFFGRFGQVDKVTIIKDKQASRSRGFGFVSFADEGIVQEVLAQHDTNKLEWEGRTLELKAAVPKGASMSAYGGQAGARNKKLYIAGLLSTTSDDALMAYFSKFGVVAEASIQKKRDTGESRGFGFVTFQDAGSVDRVLEQSHMLDNQPIDCKVAVPKLLQQPGAFSMGPAMRANNWSGNVSAWNTPTPQHFPISASSTVAAFPRATLDVRDVRNINAETNQGFAGYNANQGGYTERFGATQAVAANSAYSGPYGASASGLGGGLGASRLPVQGNYGQTANYVSGVVNGGFDNSYEQQGSRAAFAAPTYARVEPNYYSDETTYGGYDRQRTRVAYHPYSR